METMKEMLEDEEQMTWETVEAMPELPTLTAWKEYLSRRYRTKAVSEDGLSLKKLSRLCRLLHHLGQKIEAISSHQRMQERPSLSRKQIEEAQRLRERAKTVEKACARVMSDWEYELHAEEARQEAERQEAAAMKLETLRLRAEKMEEQPKVVGNWAAIRRAWLREERPALWIDLVKSGKAAPHLLAIQRETAKNFLRIMELRVEREVPQKTRSFLEAMNLRRSIQQQTWEEMIANITR